MKYLEHEPKPGEHWMDITQGMSGYFAVEYWMNNEDNGFRSFPEPWDTGIGRYATEREAYREAKAIAEEMELPLVRRKEYE